MYFQKNFDRNKYVYTASSSLRLVDTNSKFHYEKAKTESAQLLSICEKKKTKDSTDFKTFKEKEHIRDNQAPLSCFELITLPQPKLFVSLQNLNRIDFPVLSYTTSELTNFSKLIIESSAERKRIGKSFNLNKLIQLIAQNYNIASYHNFTHAFSLLLMLFQSYNRSNDLKKLITQKQWFYVFLAALAHDLGHPGTTNAFEIKKKSQLALDAGNVSVLQKFHLNNFWSILKNNSQVNFLQGYTSYQSSNIKKLITRLILSTDVASHFKNLQALKQVGHIETLNEQKQMVIVQNIFHACDIGNPCLDFKSYMSWAALVSYQFNNVAVMQQKLGLEVTTYLKYEDMTKFYNGQIGFSKGLVYPVWKQLVTIFPGLEEFQQNIENNILELQKRKEQ